LSQQQTTKDKIATKRCSRPLYSSQNTGRTTDPIITTTWKPQTPSRETTHPPDTQHQKFGESRPQPPTTPTHMSMDVTQRKQSKTLPSPGPIPQDPTARLDDPLDLIHVPHPRRGSTSAKTSLHI